MPTEVWYRNPNAYIRELVEAGQTHVAWDRGILVKTAIDPVKHAELFFGSAMDWRVLCIGEQGSADYRPGDVSGKPSAVYPTWAYGDDLAILEELLENPPGQNMALCNDMTIPADERPVWGQEHRIVIIELPSSGLMVAKAFLRTLKVLQEDYPECIIHLHGIYSWRVAFGTGFAAADIDPRIAASKGKVHLASGKEVLWEQTKKNPKWVTALGFRPADLEIPRNRCIYNIKSAAWAGQNYEKLFNVRQIRGKDPVDYTSPDADFTPSTTLSTINPKASRAATASDKILCDTCSLQDKCSYFRSGAVCSLPDAEPASLAKMFKTRDSDMIIDGLGTLIAAGTHRLERGLSYEDIDGELDPEVTKIINQTFQQATTLAKLVDPSLRGGAKVQVNVGHGGAAAVSVGSPNALMSEIVRSLEQQGIKRENITPKMVASLLENMGKDTQRTIEGTVVGEKEAG